MFFEDREVLYQESSPGGRWRLTVYAPVPDVEIPAVTRQNDPRASEVTYFAEFEKNNGLSAVGFPFGGSNRDKKLTVDWSLPGKVCSLSLDGETYLLFKWGVCFIKPRELNKLESEGPVTPGERDDFLAKALKENHEQ